MKAADATGMPVSEYGHVGAAWQSEADDFMAFSPESGKFLSGPGVIPIHGAIPLPQVIDHGQDTQTPGFDEVASLNGRQFDQPPLEEQGA
jgi:hypothetical protein